MVNIGICCDGAGGGAGVGGGGAGVWATGSPAAAGARTTCRQCGQRTLRPSKFDPTAIKFPQCGQLKFTVCIGE
jgi:hypothetical protein